ncbi:MAG: GerMN domain-containing protein [Candidatus Eremiobacteraeota bacterium]|nr:GerMN domain-containing protein [Candidatus Eremiobacteraeota bacterium]
MKSTRFVALLAVFALAVVAGWFYFFGAQRNGVIPSGDRITIYYTKTDGKTEEPFTVTLGPARDPQSVAFYAATQAIAGPPQGVDAIRFPPGTHVRSVELDGKTASVDLSSEVKNGGGGSFDEGGMFKALVWTMTALPGIDSVAIRVQGSQVATLPGGHLELDEPLARSSW